MPEGERLRSAENVYLTAELSRLRRVMADGGIIEVLVTRCDSVTMELTAQVGPFRGVIARDEVALCRDGEELRDIAIITRVGKAAAVKILSIEHTRSGEALLILSRRAAQEECSREYINRLRAGDVVPAVVTHMESFGAFLDIGCGIVSLMTIDSISVSRISHPRERFKCGEVISCVVKSIDRESGRIYMSCRELLGTWEENAAEFRAGQTVTGVVRSVESYGIFVELTPNLAGLAECRDGVCVGGTCSVYIKSIIPERMKIKLVLIDSAGAAYEPSLKYRISRLSTPHISHWRYSPAACARVIESVFDEE